MLFDVNYPIILSSNACYVGDCKNLLIVSLPNIFSSSLEIENKKTSVVYDHNFPTKYRSSIDKFINFLHRKYQVDIKLTFKNSTDLKIVDENLQLAMFLKTFQSVVKKMQIKMPLEEEIKIILDFIKKPQKFTRQILISANNHGGHYFYSDKYTHLKHQKSWGFDVVIFDKHKINSKIKNSTKSSFVEKKTDLDISLAFEALKKNDHAKLVNIVNTQQKNIYLLGLETAESHDFWINLLLSKVSSASQIFASNAFLTID